MRNSREPDMKDFLQKLVDSRIGDRKSQLITVWVLTVLVSGLAGFMLTALLRYLTVLPFPSWLAIIGGLATFFVGWVAKKLLDFLPNQEKWLPTVATVLILLTLVCIIGGLGHLFDRVKDVGNQLETRLGTPAQIIIE